MFLEYSQIAIVLKRSFVMGTEIRQFTSIKEIVDYTSNQLLQSKSLFEITANGSGLVKGL